MEDFIWGGIQTIPVDFSEEGHRKSKPNKWVKRSPKMRILIGAPAGKNLANMKKQQNHNNWGPADPPLVCRELKTCLFYYELT